MQSLHFIKNIIDRFRIFLGGVVKDAKELRYRYPGCEIGRGSYGPLAIDTFGDSVKIKIGAFCSFAKGVTILAGGEHNKNWITTYPFDRKYFVLKSAPHSTHVKGDITIGNDVWIGNGALILSGSKIGDGAIIGARAVVNGEIPPYAIAIGMPARVVRYRFSPEVISRLLKLAWWDWPDSKIQEAMGCIMNLANEENITKLENFKDENRIACSRI